jgi:hypothetical protein
VAERYQQAGAEVLRTYDDGAIIVESDGKTLRYWGYKSGKSGVIDLNAKKEKNVKMGLLTTEITKVTKVGMRGP